MNLFERYQPTVRGCKMLIHSEYGRYLIGGRKSFFGKVQMVCDFKGTCRKVYDLEAQDVSVALFNSTIKIVIQSILFCLLC